jgi:glucose-6-phosphate 1-dehydrogenase
VPFYLRTGKHSQEKTSSITVQFRPVPHLTFPAPLSESLLPNRLTINIQPRADIRLRIMAKQPALEMALQPVEMVFDYKAYARESPEAYETLLLDVIHGDATQFMRSDQVEAAWEVIMPILETWKARPSLEFPNYAAGMCARECRSPHCPGRPHLGGTHPAQR